MERIRRRALALKARFLETLTARDDNLKRIALLLQQEEAALKSDAERLAKALEAQLRRLENETAEARKRADDRWRHRTTRTRNSCERLKSAFASRLVEKLAPLQAEQKAVHARANQAYQAVMRALEQRRTAELARLAEFETRANELNARLAEFAKQRRLRLEQVRIRESLEQVGTAPEEASRELERRLKEVGALLDGAQGRTGRRIPALFPIGLLVAAHAGALLYLRRFAADSSWAIPAAEPWAIPVAVSLAVGLLLVGSLYLAASEKVYYSGMRLARKVDAIRGLLERQRLVLDRETEEVRGEADREFAGAVASLDAEVARRTEENERIAGNHFAELDAARTRLHRKISLEKSHELERAQREGEEAAARLREQHAKSLAQRQEQNLARKRELETRKLQERDRLLRQWNALLAEGEALGKELGAQARAEHPPWEELKAESWELPSEFRREVRIGEVRPNLRGLVLESDPERGSASGGEGGDELDGSGAPAAKKEAAPKREDGGQFVIPSSATLPLPLALSFPSEGSLYVRAGLSQREAGLRLLFGAVLRLLASCPPAKAKLTILDPVGLGQNFAALMHLADYDESLVGGRIWSDSAHIERKLTELTEHMEKVIQKFLRNRYATIDDYNREAGQLAEAYRFLVIADFPAGFSELALQRLASIASSGARCGVYTLILHDARQKLPSIVDEKVLRRNGLGIVQLGETFVLDDPLLNRGPLAVEPGPTPAQVDALLHCLGRQCRDSMRVEVPFEAAAPKPNEYWTCSSESGVRLPLGKTGADRLQYLELGRGTAQHALIAGKTGSGKSNLFHVIITNTALWYGPKEIEFYLIDFKKGVEFKTYAVHQLPHARVVAIESDREFGLSVLRRIDRELTRRGELFRAARVQDLPSYRQSGAAEFLPRSLLIVDEFQEFFTEDDGIGQDAALLLDRIVRQGRAFGIHVILGSQTLGGAYTLAKSTLGQMAVRIALQCNEADSYLILGDDNAAARLLARPGEAIYNDMSGQIEGNNPFQVVFFPKEVQDSFLASLQTKALPVSAAAQYSSVVFEGNSAGELRKNPFLMRLLARGRETPDAPVRVWLGEANAIKDPTAADFTRRAGSNLLVIGQRSDAGLAMCGAMLLCLAAYHRAGDARICVLDGTPPDSGAQERLAAFAAALPLPIEAVPPRRIPQLLEELAALVKARREGSPAGRSEYLLVLGLQRFRLLREDEDYSFSREDRPAASPAKLFSDLLVEGPGEGVHSIVWCDTLGNLNRAFNRKTLREFEMRVLFQMSAGDSSELVDSPVAGRLGLYSALYFTMQDGAVEKFRPYAAPDAELIAEFARGLGRRTPSSDKAAG